MNFRIVLWDHFDWLLTKHPRCLRGVKLSGDWVTGSDREISLIQIDNTRPGCPCCGHSPVLAFFSEVYRILLKMASSLSMLFTFWSHLGHACTPSCGSLWEARHTSSDKYVTCLDSELQLLLRMWLFYRIPSCFRSSFQ